jgi:hypothetical protein
MPHPPVAKRQFIAEDGSTWVVWDVHPEDLGRMSYDRRSTTPSSEDSPRVDRASRRNGRAVHPELEKGWLCFQAGIEKRRFTPIPTNWHEVPDSVLRVMLSTATPAPHADGRVPRPSATD